jgi:hypothetical protein
LKSEISTVHGLPYSPLEEWRKIPKNPLYAVSNLGRVRRQGGHRGGKYYQRRVLIRRVDRTGCLVVSGIGRVKTLVADAFIPPTGVGRVVTKDGNELNCSVWNLRRVKPRGWGNTPFTPESRVQAIEDIKRELGSPGMISRLARKYWCSRDAIRNLARHIAPTRPKGGQP